MAQGIGHREGLAEGVVGKGGLQSGALRFQILLGLGDRGEVPLGIIREGGPMPQGIGGAGDLVEDRIVGVSPGLVQGVEPLGDIAGGVIRVAGRPAQRVGGGKALIGRRVAGRDRRLALGVRRTQVVPLTGEPVGMRRLPFRSVIGVVLGEDRGQVATTMSSMSEFRRDGVLYGHIARGLSWCQADSFDGQTLIPVPTLPVPGKRHGLERAQRRCPVSREHLKDGAGGPAPIQDWRRQRHQDNIRQISHPLLRR